MIDNIIEETKEEIIRIIQEERFVAAIDKIGNIGTIGTFITLSIIAIDAILTRFLHIEHIVFLLILTYGPGIAGVFGVSSSASTYHRWLRIMRGKQKLKLKEEGTNEVQNKIADLIQSLPDFFASFFNNMVSQVSTVVLGAAVAVNAVAYVPAVNDAFNKMVNSAEKTVVRAIKRPAHAAVAREIPAMPITTTAETQTIIGTLNLPRGMDKKKKAIVELISEGNLIARAYADSYGNYAFYNMPRSNNYSINVLLEGYEEALRATEVIVDTEKPKTNFALYSSPAQTKTSPPPQYLQPLQSVPLLKSQSEPEQEPKRKPKPEPEPVVLPEVSKNSGFFVGAGSELNNNSSRKGSVAMGGNVVLGYDVNKSLALGVNTIYSNDMNAVSTLESMVLLRYYLPVMSSFLQAEGGGALSAAEGKNSVVPMGGLTAGLRLEIDKNWYIEPTLRGNYPFVLGTGITLGKSFK